MTNGCRLHVTDYTFLGFGELLGLLGLLELLGLLGFIGLQVSSYRLRVNGFNRTGCWV
jgi:cell division protein FtsW (lipid II flippase)